jgi:hypothetical protein
VKFSRYSLVELTLAMAGVTVMIEFISGVPASKDCVMERFKLMGCKAWVTAICGRYTSPRVPLAMEVNVF